MINDESALILPYFNWYVKEFLGQTKVNSAERVIFLVKRWVLFLLTLFFCSLTASAGGISSDNPKFVALTFDDGPTKNVTPLLLDGLSSHYVNATFFLCGYRMDEQPDLVQCIQSAGHEIGIHGYSHTFLQNLSQEDVERELTQSAEILTAITGTVPTLFRAPGGLTNDTVMAVAEALGLSVIHWSVDPVDWNGGDPHQLAKTILDTAKDGDIILMHDLQKTSVEAAMLVIDGLEAQGFQFVTLSELAILKGKPLEPGTAYWKF